MPCKLLCRLVARVVPGLLSRPLQSSVGPLNSVTKLTVLVYTILYILDVPLLVRSVQLFVSHQFIFLVPFLWRWVMLG
jgi:hypothetical protein